VKLIFKKVKSSYSIQLSSDYVAEDIRGKNQDSYTHTGENI